MLALAQCRCLVELVQGAGNQVFQVATAGQPVAQQAFFDIAVVVAVDPLPR